GLFSPKPIDESKINNFLDHIPEEYEYINIQLNYLNESNHPDFEFVQRENLVIYLNGKYEDVRKNYNTNTKRNLAAAANNELTMRSDIKPEVVVDFFKKHTAPRIKGIRAAHFHSLHRIIYQARHHSMGQTYGVYSKEN